MRPMVLVSSDHDCDVRLRVSILRIENLLMVRLGTQIGYILVLRHYYLYREIYGT